MFRNLNATKPFDVISSLERPRDAFYLMYKCHFGDLRRCLELLGTLEQEFAEHSQGIFRPA